MIKCCLFDLDGTLVNSLDDLANATNAALEELGFEGHENSAYKYFVGNGVAKLIERALPEKKRDEATQKRMREIFDRQYSEHCLDCTKPYLGIKELLDDLKKNEIKLAVVTNKPEAIAIKIVENLFPNSFDKICGNTAKFPTKPAPDAALDVALNFKTELYNCAFIGDSNVDIQTAINAKMLSVGVTWGFRTKDELQQAGAKFVIDEPFELLEVIK